MTPFLKLEQVLIGVRSSSHRTIIQIIEFTATDLIESAIIKNLGIKSHQFLNASSDL